jgi:hypothetical protein
MHWIICPVTAQIQVTLVLSQKSVAFSFQDCLAARGLRLRLLVSTVFPVSQGPQLVHNATQSFSPPLPAGFLRVSIFSLWYRWLAWWMVAISARNSLTRSEMGCGSMASAVIPQRRLSFCATPN